MSSINVTDPTTKCDKRATRSSSASSINPDHSSSLDLEFTESASHDSGTPKAPTYSRMLEAVPAWQLMDADSELAVPEALFSDRLTKKSFQYAGLDKFIEQAFDHQLSVTPLSLARYLSNPATSKEEIEQRRNCLKEIREDANVRAVLERVVDTMSSKGVSRLTGLQEALTLFSDRDSLSYESRSFIETIRYGVQSSLYKRYESTLGLRKLRKVLNELSQLSGCKSNQLRELGERAKSILEDPSAIQLKGRVGVTLKGFSGRHEVPRFTPSIPFKITGVAILRNITALGSIAFLGTQIASNDNLNFSFNPAKNLDEIEENLDEILGLSTGEERVEVEEPKVELSVSIVEYLVILSGLGGARIGAQMFSARAVESFIEGCKKSELVDTFDLVGEAEALLSLASFDAKTEQESWIHSTILENTPYYFAAESLHNPTLKLDENTESMPNDIELRSGKPLMATGGNSAGKSTLGTTVFQASLLNQLGLRVPATRCTMSIADSFVSRGPIDQKLGAEGRLGAELAETREAFESVTPNSIAILDEIIGGTSENEGREISEYTVKGFRDIGCGIVAITHDLALANKLAKEGIVEAVTPTFEDGSATFIFESGLASESGAQRVAERVGMSKADVAEIVAAKRTES